MAESNVKDKEAGKPEVSYVITEEVLLAVLGNKSTPSRVHALSTHPLVVLICGGAVVAAIGGFLTHFYTLKQKEIDYNRSIQQLTLTSQRSFCDELNKIRIQKIGGMWEQIDKNETLIARLLDKTDKSTNSSNQRNGNVEAIKDLIEEDRMIINTNWFWLGEQRSNETKASLKKNVDLALNVLLASPGTDLSEMIEERERAKQDIIQIRTSMLSEGEPCK